MDGRLVVGQAVVAGMGAALLLENLRYRPKRPRHRGRVDGDAVVVTD